MSEDNFESMDIRDMPDSWFDVIQKEANEFLEKTDIYPTELTIIIIQVIFQNFVYSCLSTEDRSRFLGMLFDTFMAQFEEWDKEADSFEGESTT